MKTAQVPANGRERDMMVYLKRLILPLILVLTLLAVAVGASRYASLEWLTANDAWLRDQIQAHPARSAVWGFLAYLALSLIPGTSGKSLILGWLFGVMIGVVIVHTALVSAAVVTFLLCRHYLRAAVHARFGFYLRPVQSRMRENGAMYLLTLRLAHAPFSFVNYAAGAGTEVSFRTFLWTTYLGMLPGNLIFVFAGSRLPTLQELVEHGPLGLLDGPMIAALAGTVLLPWMARKLVLSFQASRSGAAELPDGQARSLGR